MASTPELIRIHYNRLPGRTEVYEQTLLHRDDACAVTFLPSTPVRAPLVVDGRTVLEPGAPVIWFTFPAAWHDIGRFHTADGVFTGLYANVLTPIERIDGNHWETTDLFLDVWLGAEDEPAVLDEDELAAALAHRWVDEATAARARQEAISLTRRWRQGAWPPAIVDEWTLHRALAAARTGEGTHGHPMV